ncbi:hypothetical protein [Kitasatospora sp. NPDC051914]|uniref:hypothetical protein n=1 Tax=Kitasatospora sp. NPDC051914 TaxID=3154945 RepID=UPI0034187C3B
MSSHGEWQGPQFGPGGGGGQVPWGQAAPAPQPGVVPLRPLKIGDIISGVFATVQRYPAALFVPLLWTALGSLVVFGVLAVVAFLVLDGPYRAIIATETPATGDLVALLSVAAAAFLVLAAALTALYAVSSATATVVLRYAVIGRRKSGREIWAEARPAVWRVVVSQFLVGGIATGIVLVSYLPAVLIGIATHGDPTAAVALLLAVPGWAGAVYVQVRLVLEVPVLVMEDTTALAALRRAWRLNEGNWWRSFGIPYVVSLIGSFAAQIALAPFMLVGLVTLFSSMGEDPADPYGEPTAPSLGALVVMLFCVAVGLVAATALTMPLTPLTNGLLYIDRRIRRESLDVSLAAAAGLRPWPEADVPAQAGPPADGPSAAGPGAAKPGTGEE